MGVGRTGRLLLGAGLTWAAVVAASRALVVVEGWSMAPTLVPGERLLTLPVPRRPSGLRARLVRPGAVVVVEAPSTDGPAADVDANGAHASAERVHRGDHPQLAIKRVRRVDVDGVLVEGDHPTRSTDGRAWGPLAQRAVRAVVVARWPRVWRRP